jgi:hypothetical protein
VSVSLPNLFPVQCNWCSHYRPAYASHQLENGLTICEYCLQRHIEALDFLGTGRLPDTCQCCGKTWVHLAATAEIAIKIYIVPKDGIYQLLCDSCIGPYTLKRSDLYKGSRFGASL